MLWEMGGSTLTDTHMPSLTLTQSNTMLQHTDTDTTMTVSSYAYLRKCAKILVLEHFNNKTNHRKEVMAFRSFREHRNCKNK
ncbi:hypothetical protein XELAEV_18028802mg [Xenopus laevis]|uniref:Uncharacterized protein n=1 Tax=Xenopus laevis TaxID=8355 RepID=A0A974CQG0_XENLA|nr:hypothetical protein XELAEV_18028802mg [Xenopus laevis]